jgi:hypothetical protein
MEGVLAVTRRFARIPRVALVAIFIAVFLPASAQAAPFVLSNVSSVGTQYQYDYSLDFDFDPDPAEEPIAILDINVLPNDTSLAVLGAPVGYFIVYDSGLGLLSFLPVGTFPTTGTVGLFSILSAHAPLATTWNALGINSGFYTGATVGPLGPIAPVPEPSTWLLLAMAFGALGGRRAVTMWRGSRG